jgi:hypothetical protein
MGHWFVYYFVVVGDKRLDVLLYNQWLVWLIDWYKGSVSFSPDAPRPSEKQALCAPVVFHGSLAALLKRQMAPRFCLLMSSGSRKKEPKYACLVEAKASHWQRMWAEVSCSAPHFLHGGLSVSPSDGGAYAGCYVLLAVQ